jgi:hypothetical protein
MTRLRILAMVGLGQRRRREVRLGAACVAAAIVLAACGSTSHTAGHPAAGSRSIQPTLASPPPVTVLSTGKLAPKNPAQPGARSIERALLAQPHEAPTTASCRASASAERAAVPFGHTRLPLFTCELTVTGERASYLVQVLGNGCFVAEGRRVRRAVYGCGAHPFLYK